MMLVLLSFIVLVEIGGNSEKMWEEFMKELKKNKG